MKKREKDQPAPGDAGEQPVSKLQQRLAELERKVEQVEESDHAKSRLLALLGRITAQQTVDDICRTTVEGVRELLGFERAGLFLWDEKRSTFHGTYGTDMALHTTDEHDYWMEILPGSPEERIIKGSIIERGCKLGSPVAQPGEEDIKADLLGLRVGGRLYGLLSVDNRLSRRPITGRQLEHLLLVSQVLGNAMEISRARVALESSEQRFRQVAETSDEWIWELDRNGRYTYCSPTVLAILGYTPEEAAGTHILEWSAENDRAAMDSLLRRGLREGSRIQRVINHQHHKDGSPVTLETSGIPIVDGEGRIVGYRGAHRNVTREEQLQAQLRHSQKIDAIGRLAGGIAHDFNNILTSILGCSSLLLEEMAKDDGARTDVQNIKSAAERAATLTRELLAFSRRQAMQVRELDLNDVVRQMEDLLRRTISEDIELTIRLGKDLPNVKADEGELQQIMLHLVVNARDAMIDPCFMSRAGPAAAKLERHRAALDERAKRLVVETLGVTIDEDYDAGHVGAPPGRYAVLVVSDTGIGMPEEVQEHLFEPFFTTREVGRGSGLGLSTAYGIVREMGGFIGVESTLGEGSTFRVYLPSIEGAARKSAMSKDEKNSIRGNETILVVEDEEVVRQLTVRMLHTLGYTVLSAAHGGEALQICEHHTGPIDLILTDMVMPHVSGKQFVEALKAMQKDFRVLFVSGYSSDETVAGTELGVTFPMIQKPFTRETLGKRIREVLDTVPAGDGEQG